MKRIKVIFIAADGCTDCSTAKKKVSSILDEASIAYDLEVLDYASEKAINLAIDHGLDTLPSFIVNNTGFNGKLVLKEAIISAAKRKK